MLLYSKLALLLSRLFLATDRNVLCICLCLLWAFDFPNLINSFFVLHLNVIQISNGLRQVVDISFVNLLR